MQRQILERRNGVLPAAAVILLLCLGPLTLSAQSTKKDDDPERERKSSSTSVRDRAHQEAERREREERREIQRRQDAMREADLENAAQRQRQDAKWAREMERQRQRDQPAPNPTYRAPSYTTSPAQRAPGSYGAPAATSTPRQDTESSRFTCSAHPSCPSETGRGNVCKGVQGSYTGAGASNDGLRDIITRCRNANLPEPCNTDPRGTPSRPNYRLTTTLGCAQQCATLARCSPITAR